MKAFVRDGRLRIEAEELSDLAAIAELAGLTLTPDEQTPQPHQLRACSNQKEDEPGSQNLTDCSAEPAFALEWSAAPPTGSVKDVYEGPSPFAAPGISDAAPASASPAAHSSRNTPACSKCTHYYGDERCNHPITAVDFITGKPVVNVRTMRHNPATPALSPDAPLRCGPSGALFELAPASIKPGHGGIGK